MINIEGIAKPRLLASLYNASRAVGIGKYQYNKNHNMTYREAEKYLENKTDYDLLIGRIIYMDFSGNEIDETKYDKYLGEGSAKAVIDKIREYKKINIETNIT